ncbi:hypothetical protein ACO9S2_17550 [Nitrospira sp. NS4]|uniref:hypothetical protein n=1 Tax=Nitrospira sp. NS4 TaxID=3414498 RepID=UPI003C2F3FEC
MATLHRMAVFLTLLGAAGPCVLAAAEEEPAEAPGYSERLDQALGAEGGVQVYMDPEGNVGTIIDPPGGERQITIQLPQSPWINLGPPLQLHNSPFHVPPTVGPGKPPAQEFPRKAR